MRVFQNQEQNVKVNMIVVSHKPFQCPKVENYIPVYVGDKNFDTCDGFRDDAGINIANKNKNYCELTAMYWYWKNKLSSAEFVGLCHYRRFFTSVSWLKNERFFLNTDKILNYMENSDIILPEPMELKCSVFENYFLHGEGKKNDLELIGKIIKDQCPDYLVSYNTILKRTSASYCNMFVTDKVHFQAYCEWLFNILFIAEKEIDISAYTVQEARIFGYLSEILLNIWVLNNNLKVKYVPVILLSMKYDNLLKQYIRKRFMRN